VLQTIGTSCSEEFSSRIGGVRVELHLAGSIQQLEQRVVNVSAVAHERENLVEAEAAVLGDTTHFLVGVNARHHPLQTLQLLLRVLAP
jgi:hypothetical protein